MREALSDPTRATDERNDVNALHTVESQIQARPLSLLLGDTDSWLHMKVYRGNCNRLDRKQHEVPIRISFRFLVWISAGFFPSPAHDCHWVGFRFLSGILFWMIGMHDCLSKGGDEERRISRNLLPPRPHAKCIIHLLGGGGGGTKTTRRMTFCTQTKKRIPSLRKTKQ